MKVFMFSLFLTFCGIAYGQNQLRYQGSKGRIITGKVLAYNGTAVVGATVQVKGTNIGVITNSEGGFTLKVPDSLFNNNIKLNLTYVGYAPYVITFDSGKYSVDKFVNITLNPLELHRNPGRPQSLPTAAIHNTPPELPSPDSEKRYVYNAPSFPWPPPDFSSDFVLDKRYFKNPRTLADLDLILTRVLDALNYNDRAYFSVPNGFALVTRIEQTDEDGQALDPPDRWSVKVDALDQGGWTAYIKALIFPPTGHFRIIVFTVTDHPFKGSGKVAGETTAIGWLHQGLNILPPEIGTQLWTANYNCTALIYEFKKVENGNADILIPGILTGKNHLDKSGILQLLSKY